MCFGPDRETTLARALGRAKLDEATNRQLMETMWEQFARLGPWEPYALDTTCLSPRETAALLQEKLRLGLHRLGAG